MNNYFANPLVFVIEVVFNLFLLAVILRFLFQLLSVNFYNPLSQSIVKLTTPLLHPLRRIIPGYKRVDVACIVLALLITFIKNSLIFIIGGGGLSPNVVLARSLYEITELTLNIFFFAIIVQAILSWVAPGQQNPITIIISQLTAPILRPIRRVMPKLEGLDLSPMVALVTITVLKKLILPLFGLII